MADRSFAIQATARRCQILAADLESNNFVSGVLALESCLPGVDMSLNAVDRLVIEAFVLQGAARVLHRALKSEGHAQHLDEFLMIIGSTWELDRLHTWLKRLADEGQTAVQQNQDPVRLVAQTIDSTYSDATLNLRKLAKGAGLSPWHLARQFKRRFQVGVIEYLQHRRVIEASRLLRNTDIQIKAVAADVGFRTTAHLDRHFKREYGFRPSIYRNQRRMMVGRQAE